MNIIVTGGAGFIGSHLANSLIEDGHRVTIVDNLKTGFKSNIPSQATFLELDVSQDSFINELPTNTDIFYHLAANSSGEISYYEPSYDLKTNALSTLLSLKWAKENNIKKYIYTSSMNVYGNNLKMPTTESSTLDPLSFYSVSKIASENYISIFQDMGLQTSTLRLFNIYGPGQNMDNLKQGMVSIYMAYIAKNDPILVKGALDRFRDFVYIDDCVSALKLCLSEKSNGKLYNVSTNRKTTVSSLLSTIKKSFDKPENYPVQEIENTPRDQFGMVGDYQLIQSDLGWQPKTSLETGIQQMADWVRSVISISQ